MNKDTAEAPCFLHTYLARQPIFDTRSKVWGYELLFRGGPNAERADISDLDQATLDVAADSTIAAEDFYGSDKKILLNFGEQNILESVPYALPPGQTVIQIPESALASDETIEALRDLVRNGYSIAVDDFEGKVPVGKDLADLVIIDTLGKSPAELAPILDKAKEAGALMLAKRVEDMETFSMAKELGFPLFQGYFFKRPELVSGKKLTSHQASRFSLLKAIEQKDPDFEALAKDIQTDVSISYRLLTYLNSAAFSFTQPIQSIKQAIVLLGWKQLRSWLRVIVLTDLQPKGKSSELFFIAVQRGKFLELISHSHDQSKADPDSMFLLGLLSLLEAMLEMPMADIVGKLPLAQDLKSALLGEDTDHAKWLELVRAHEKGKWEDLDHLTDKLGLNRLVVAVSYYKSVLWANTFFKHGPAEADQATEES
ncbi:EAL and HDOD domain-containing protein [Desulfovibrio ferrophilus]|uniref:Diguanylate phosphodiesterase n=1 Tax=Desulfovibrio ferrophilus TaxID=241368 RepID=A0A2Z6B323_9BACT|nr:HDOD domain-containing protein [Desulfovibrio ferrophilus]BBD09863.1 diguanylate phosphodiesterase [Desulfovibrio ferrophilus]